MSNAPVEQQNAVCPPATPSLHVQWHITSKCGNRCKHCYMFDPATAAAETAEEPGFDQLLRILDSICEFESKWGARVPDFYITGGDPLLHDSWDPLLAELRRRRKRISLFGNPETLTNDKAARLVELGVASFQMSLDGLKETHDTMRAPGSFERTVDKLGLLAEHGIHGHIMFTLFKENADELIPLLRYTAQETQASVFCFDIGCFVGSAAGQNTALEPGEVRDLFAAYLDEKQRLRESGNKLVIDEKPKLFLLARLARGAFFPVNAEGIPTVTGCLCGWTGASILPDGSVLPCRRLPMSAGKMPEQSFENIFLGSELMRKFRRASSFAECGSCDLYKFCRGCPAYVYGVTGDDPFAAYPLCFRSSVDVPARPPAGRSDDPPIDIDNDEEYGLVARGFSATQADRTGRLMRDPELQRVFLNLATSPADRAGYLADPYAYVESLGVELSDLAHVFLVQHFSRVNAPGVNEADDSPLGAVLLEQMLAPEPRTDKPGLRRLMARAWEDDDFRKALLASPKATIEKELGVRLPAQPEIHVHEQTHDTMHILLPPLPVEIREREQPPTAGE